MPKRRPDQAIERTCAVCRSVHAKGDMQRVVRQADGSVTWDPSGRTAGRGTYVCADPSCHEPRRMAAAVGRALTVSSGALAHLAEEQHAPA